MSRSRLVTFLVGLMEVAATLAILNLFGAPSALMWLAFYLGATRSRLWDLEHKP